MKIENKAFWKTQNGDENEVIWSGANNPPGQGYSPYSDPTERLDDLSPDEIFDMHNQMGFY